MVNAPLKGAFFLKIGYQVSQYGQRFFIHAF